MAGSKTTRAEKCGMMDHLVCIMFSITLFWHNTDAFVRIAAMYNFAKAQSTWYETWPTDPKERGMAMCVSLPLALDLMN